MEPMTTEGAAHRARACINDIDRIIATLPDIDRVTEAHLMAAATKLTRAVVRLESMQVESDSPNHHQVQKTAELSEHGAAAWVEGLQVAVDAERITQMEAHAIVHEQMRTGENTADAETVLYEFTQGRYPYKKNDGLK